MSGRQYKWALLVLAVSGLAGGTLGSWLLPGRATFVQEQALPVVTAREFRLVDEAGRCGGRLYLKEMPSGASKTTLILSDIITPDSWTSLTSDELTVHFQGMETCIRPIALTFYDSDGHSVGSIVPPYDFVNYKALDFTAYHNCAQALTERLQQKSCVAYSIGGLYLTIDTRPQPGWNVHRGRAHFDCSDREVRAAYREAAEQVMGWVREGYDEIGPEDVKMTFTILGYPVGTWQDGKMTLEGEE